MQGLVQEKQEVLEKMQKTTLNLPALAWVQVKVL